MWFCLGMKESMMLEVNTCFSAEEQEWIDNKRAVESQRNDRHRKAILLRDGGFTFREIGKQLDVTASRAMTIYRTAARRRESGWI